jgi:uncharacterized cupin superfamily protein
MKHALVSALGQNPVNPADGDKRSVADALGCDHLGLNYYELDPGDSFAFAYHSHGRQEEIFYIQEGTATFETEDGPVDVTAGEAIRFDREEFQRGWNRGDERVVALALGAPLEYRTQVKLRDCDSCGERTDNRLERVGADGEEVVVALCQICGEETGRWYRGPMEGEVP